MTVFDITDQNAVESPELWYVTFPNILAVRTLDLWPVGTCKDCSFWCCWFHKIIASITPQYKSWPLEECCPLGCDTVPSGISYHDSESSTVLWSPLLGPKIQHAYLLSHVLLWHCMTFKTDAMSLNEPGWNTVVLTLLSFSWQRSWRVQLGLVWAHAIWHIFIHRMPFMLDHF